MYPWKITRCLHIPVCITTYPCQLALGSLGNVFQVAQFESITGTNTSTDAEHVLLMYYSFCGAPCTSTNLHFKNDHHTLSPD